MFPTVEVRWFYQGTIPRDIQTWFDQIDDQGAQPISQPPRTDTYLLEADNTSLGIKLRQGRIEIKQRLEVFGHVNFGQDIHGVIERWRKWSFMIAPEQNNLLCPATLGITWIDVHKRRSLYNYQIKGQRIECVPLPDYSSGGCNFELTRIHIAGKTCWSLGLEAFGDENSNYNRLEIVAKYIFTKSLTHSLNAQDSYGYPQWLDYFARKI